MKITFSIKRGSFWQDGKQRSANNADPELRTISLTEVERDEMDPSHTDLQSADEARLEAKKLGVDAGLAEKRAAALAKIDADHAAELKAEVDKKADAEKKAKAEADKKAGGK